MSVKMVHETTILGDKYGKQVKQNGVVIQTATRTFTVEVDNSADRSINEVYALLPKKGDSHPYITNIPACLVKDITVAVTKDPHIYEATVEYSTEVDLNDGGDDAEEAPWNQPGVVTLGVDASQTTPSELAYLEWPYTEVGTMEPGSLGSPIGSMTGPPSRPVTNKPMNEKFTTVPEEPSGGVAINVSFAEKAARTGGVLSTQTITDLISEALTVNTDGVSFAGYSIAAYKGYVSDVTSELAFYRKTPRHAPVAYFNIRITLLINPKTWIRYIQNMSRNQVSVDTKGNNYLSPIQVADKTSGLKADVKEPVLVHPTDGQALGFDANGYAVEDNRIYVIPYLTKRPSAWSALINILNRVLS